MVRAQFIIESFIKLSTIFQWWL